MAVRMADMMQTVSDVYRQFIPSEKGKSLDEQIYPWSFDGIKEAMKEPFQPHQLDPQSLAFCMQMMAVESQHWLDYHAWCEWVSDKDLKSLLGQLARAEHLHHLKIMSILPPPHAPSESILSMETAILMAYRNCIEHEPNEAVSNAFSRIFEDHLTHAEFAATDVQQKGCPPQAITGGANLSGGRRMESQFMKVEDTIWQGRFDGCYSKDTVDPITLVNVDMSLAGEVAAWHGYHCALANTGEGNIRTAWAAFQSIEDQHVGILGSLRDPTESLLERCLVHEQVEVRNYRMMAEADINPQVKEIFQDLYQEDLQQAWELGQLAK